MLYLDHNATTRPTQAVLAAMQRAAEHAWQNPSSIHRAGQSVRREVELARRDVATLLNAKAREVIFTASGSESLHLAVQGVLAASPRSAIVSTSVEHHALLHLLEHLGGREGVDVRCAPLDGEGRVDLDALPAILDDRVALVSVQWANNETGAIQPLAEIASLCRERGIPLHTDATQWVGKMPTNVGTGRADRPEEPIGVDLLTAAPHKFHGPKGMGLLWVRQGVRIFPTVHGAQEMGRRGGTENVPAIVATGVACREADEWLEDPAHRCTQRRLRDRFERAVLAADPQASVNAPADPDARVWNTANIAFPGIESEALLMLLSERGVCASAGSACSSGALQPSQVLLNSGVSPERATSSIRFSICRFTTRDEIDQAVEIVADCVTSLRGSAAPASGAVASSRARG